jgi:hypothetical protein
MWNGFVSPILPRRKWKTLEEIGCKMTDTSCIGFIEKAFEEQIFLKKKDYL